MDEGKTRMERKAVFQSLIRGGEACIRNLEKMESRAQQVNDALLRELLHKNARTEYGKKYGFDRIKSYEQYAAQVPLTDYSDYEAYIRRMSEEGESNVLTSSRVDFYFSTAGTMGKAKRIPSTREQFRLITSYTNLYRYGLAAGTLGDIWTDGATLSPVEVRMKQTESGVAGGCFSAKLFHDLGDLLHIASLSPREAIYSELGEDTQYIHLLYALKREDVTEMNASYIPWLLEMMRRLEGNWEEYVRDIREGTLPLSLNLSSERYEILSATLSPDPERADALEREFRKGFDEPILPRIWKKLSLVVAACSGSFSPYLKQFRRYIGEDIPVYCHGYTASEGVLAAPVALNSTQFVLLPDSCFFEFQPFDENSGAAAVDKNGMTPVLKMDQLEEGKAYLVIITNRAGLYRYRMHDVIRVTGFRGILPVIEMMYREGTTLSIVGEHITEDELSKAVFRTAEELKMALTGFSVYTEPDAKPRGRYVFFIEPAGNGPLPDPAKAGERIMDYLEENNEEFQKARAYGWITSPALKYLKAGTYEQYRAFTGDQSLGGNQIKPPQILLHQKQIDFFLEHERT